MKKLLLPLLLALSYAAFSQRTFPLRFEKDSLVFKIKVQNDQLIVEQQGTTTLFASKSDYPVILQALFDDGDLILQYKEKAAGDLLSYKIAMQLKLPNGTVLDPTENEVSNVYGPLGFRKLSWMNAVSLLEDFDGTHTLYVTRTLMGAVNCDARRPQMSVKLRGVSYVGTTIGGLFLYIGHLYRVEKRDAYNDYERLWQEGNAKPELLNSPLEAAKKNDRNARIFTWTGIGLIAANATVFNIIAYKTKKKQKYYDQFCGNENKTSFQLAPSKKGFGIVLNF